MCTLAVVVVVNSLTLTHYQCIDLGYSFVADFHYQFIDESLTFARFSAVEMRVSIYVARLTR